MRSPPPGCWSCGAVPSKEDIALLSVLRARTAAEGGPWVRFVCGGCGAEGVLEEEAGREPVLAPPEAIGFDVPVVAALLEGKRGRDLRRRSREWTERYGEAFAALRAGGPRASPAPPTGPRGRGGDSSRAAGARRPPAPVRAPAGLPSTPEEARAVLGIARDAAREEVDAAFRKASRRCHPDLVAHLDEDFQRLAHDKFLRIRRAHEILTR